MEEANKERPFEERGKTNQALVVCCLSLTLWKLTPHSLIPNPQTFPSMKAAAVWIVKEGLGRLPAGALHTICEVCCGRRKTAYYQGVA